MTHKAKPRELIPEDFKNAAQVCFRNAEELLADAEFLFYSERHARGVFLACVGFEELGKARLCLDLYDYGWKSGNRPRVSEFLSFWRHHQSKAAHGLGWSPVQFDPEMLKRLCTHMLPAEYDSWEDFENGWRSLVARLSGVTLSIKEASLYVDFVDPGLNEQHLGLSLPSANYQRPKVKDCGKQMIRNLRDQIDDLRPRIRKLGPLTLPPYPPNEYPEMNDY